MIQAEEKPEKDDVDLLTSCGIGRWRPQWMQRFASPRWFLLNMSMVGVIQGMSGPLFLGSITTLEKRYSFDSKISAIIFIADNFSQMVTSPFVGYFGVRYNRVLLMGLSELLLAVSCFIVASPYFIFGPATHLLNDPSLLSTIKNGTLTASSLSNERQLCLANPEEYDCSDNGGTTVWLAVAILFVGNFFRGIGHTAYYVVGFPYLDDNVSKESSPMYLSTVFSIRLIGPATGYMLSSFVLRFYENPLIDPGIERTDPRFIGAWWIGFCLVGVLLFLSSLPLFLFPIQFKNASVKAEVIQDQLKESGGGFDAVRRFFQNPILVLCLISSSFGYIGVGGYVMFKNKYIESQYRVSSSAASFITGSVTIMPMAVGILLSGLIIKIFKPRPKTIFIFLFAIQCFVVCTYGTAMFLGCDPIKIQGEFKDLPDQKYSLSVSCNANCNCNTRVFSPHCGPDESTTYFSACHAGCASFNTTSYSFGDCSCFEGSPSAGFCSKDIQNCNNLYTYLISILIGAVVSSLGVTSHWLISFRSVAPMDKSFTMGMFSSLMAIFSFIPYPLIFGAIVDSVCLVWEKKCGKTGNYWMYDQEKFRYYLHGAAITFMAIGGFFQVALIFYADRIKGFYDDDAIEEEEEEETNEAVATELVREIRYFKNGNVEQVNIDE